MNVHGAFLLCAVDCPEDHGQTLYVESGLSTCVNEWCYAYWRGNDTLTLEPCQLRRRDS